MYIYLYSVYRGDIYDYAEECRRLWMGMFAGEKTERQSEHWVITVEVTGCSEVRGGLGGEGLDAAGVTVFAEDVSVQRVAALVIPL